MRRGGALHAQGRRIASSRLPWPLSTARRNAQMLGAHAGEQGTAICSAFLPRLPRLIHGSRSPYTTRGRHRHYPRARLRRARGNLEPLVWRDLIAIREAIAVGRKTLGLKRPAIRGANAGTPPQRRGDRVRNVRLVGPDIARQASNDEENAKPARMRSQQHGAHHRGLLANGGMWAELRGERPRGVDVRLA